MVVASVAAPHIIDGELWVALDCICTTKRKCQSSTRCSNSLQWLLGICVFLCFQIVPHCSVGNLGFESFWPTMLRFVVGRCHLWGSNCSNCQTPARIHYDVSLLRADHFTNISPSPEVTRAHSSSKQRSAAIGKALPAARPSYLWPEQKTSWFCGCETVLFVALIVQCSYLDESANCCATAQSMLVCFFFERTKKNLMPRTRAPLRGLALRRGNYPFSFLSPEFYMDKDFPICVQLLLVPSAWFSGQQAKPRCYTDFIGRQKRPKLLSPVSPVLVVRSQDLFIRFPRQDSSRRKSVPPITMLIYKLYKNVGCTTCSSFLVHPVVITCYQYLIVFISYN